jgi:hypothetical protein
MPIKHLINGMKHYPVKFFRKRILVCISSFCHSKKKRNLRQGELLIDVEDKLIRKKYVSSLDIEIVSECKINSIDEV